MPLALRVAGNYLALNDDCPPAEYAALLADERRRLERLRDPDDPDLDVEATLSLTVQQLQPDLQRRWALLSLFRAPFDVTAAAVVWEMSEKEDAAKRLRVLRSWSLVTFEAKRGRFELHDLVQLAAGRELEQWDTAEVEPARARFAAHYEGVLGAAVDLYLWGGEDVLLGLALFDQERPHIEAGQAWAAARCAEDEAAARLCSAYPDAGAYVLNLRLHAQERIGCLEAAADGAQRDPAALGHPFDDPIEVLTPFIG